MKQFNLWFILALIAVLATTCASQLQTTDYTYTVQTDTIPDHSLPRELGDTIKLEDILLYTDRDGVMYFDTNKTKHLHGFTGDSIVHYYGYLFDVGKHNELRFQSKITTDYKYKGKITTYFYSLYHKGYFCKRVVASFGEKGNQIFEGSFSKFDLDIDTIIKIKKEATVEIAKNNLDEKRYAWEEKGWENFATKPEPNLVIKEVSKNKYRLAYEGYYTVLPLKTYLIHIDAQTGEVISKKWNGGHCTGCQNCNNEVVHNGVVPLNYQNLTESIWIKQCSTGISQCNKLKQTNHHKINFVSALQNGPPQDVCWETGSQIPSDTALSLYWGVQTAYDYLLSSFSYHGFDSTNAQATNVLLDVGDNAYFDISPAGLSLAFGTGSPPNKPWITLDAVGHEIAHGIDKKNINLHSLPSYSEGLIIMESFCDIMGIAVEATKKTNDWAIQNDFTSSEIRYMNMPDSSVYQDSVSPQPKFYKGNNWLDTTVINQRYIHHNNGVMNYWFYLITEGTNNGNFTNNIYTNQANESFSFNGIGINAAIEIIFKTFTDEFKKPIYPIKSFTNLRKATLKVAKNEYGCNNGIWETLRQAWDAVGVTALGCEEEVNIYSVCTSPSTCIATITMCGDMNNPRVIVKDLTTNSNVYNNKPNGILTLSNLVCGRTYKVTVKDKNNPLCEDVVKYFTCQSNNASTGSINVCPPSVEFWASPNIINNCDDNNDINLSVSGGVPPYSYIWSNGGNSQNLTNIASGTYSVTVVDDCYNNITQTVTVNGYPTLNVSGQTQPLCSPTDLGSIDLSVSGGQTPYTYHWSNGATTQDISGLAVGSYSVTVTDGNNCTKSLNYYIGVSSPTIYSSNTTASCPLGDDGAVNIGLIGGTSPYTYQWQGPSNTQTVQNPSGLKSGQHCVTVTDANGCTVSSCYTVAQASYSWAYDRVNCNKVYTCRGQDYITSMFDFDNPDNDFDQCTTEIPCLIPNGESLITGGTVYSWHLSSNDECRFLCQLGTEVGTGEPDDDEPTLQSTGIPCETSDGFGGTFYDFYCNGLLMETRCLKPDDVARVGNINNPILVYPSPFGKKVSIEFESNLSESTNAIMYNISGQEVFNQKIIVGKGINHFDFNITEDLPNGVYVLKIRLSNGHQYIQKMIHQN